MCPYLALLSMLEGIPKVSLDFVHEALSPLSSCHLKSWCRRPTRISCLYLALARPGTRDLVMGLISQSSPFGKDTIGLICNSECSHKYIFHAMLCARIIFLFQRKIHCLCKLNISSIRFRLKGKNSLSWNTVSFL